MLRAVRTGIEAMALGSGKRRVAVPLDPLSAIMSLPIPTLRAMYAGRLGPSDAHCDKKAPNSLFWILVSC